jgi:hypothetical protein
LIFPLSLYISSVLSVAANAAMGLAATAKEPIANCFNNCRLEELFSITKIVYY